MAKAASVGLGPLVSVTALSIYGLFFVVGFVGALVLPTFSLFLAKEIGARPLLVGLPFAGIALASLVYNHYLGRWSDQLRDRRSLMCVLCCLGMLVCLLFAFSRNYWLVATTAVLLFSLAMVAFAQMLAYSLDYAEGAIAPERIPLFNALVRAQIAFAWVIGPPAGFLLASYIGFRWSYSIAAVLYLLVGVACLKLPDLASHKMAGGEQAPDLVPLSLTPAAKQSLIFCALAFSLLWGVNNAYLISLPIHLEENLKLGTQWTGWVMGTTAALEVPFMLLAGYYAARLSPIVLIRVAAVAALLLYLGVYWAGQLWQLFALQIFNAAFIGILAGLAVSVIQLLMPGRSGAASGLYSNTIHMGNLISSLLVGVVADYLGYQQVFVMNVVMVVIALWALGRVRLA